MPRHSAKPTPVNIRFWIDDLEKDLADPLMTYAGVYDTAEKLISTIHRAQKEGKPIVYVQEKKNGSD